MMGTGATGLRRPLSFFPQGLLRTTFESVTWKGILTAESLGLLIAVGRCLRLMGTENWMPHLLLNVIFMLLVPPLVLLAILAADQNVRRGARAAFSYPLALLLVAVAALMIQIIALVRSQMAASRLQVNPTQLFESMGRAKAAFETGAADADHDLDVLIQELRDRRKAYSADRLQK